MLNILTALAAISVAFTMVTIIGVLAYLSIKTQRTLSGQLNP